ncbi:cobaltochelatase CobT-related protein [Burkholderia sp. BCC1972]|uniref:cobaltochelatase CobT-related protein n=1 Tax=Burkholderia sp. BCC1972 TaxID=2817438 RepID=UPI002ABDA360|nr:cobalamin biosynthesis protein CobT [Burkholderia sp. BCC1972]
MDRDDDARSQHLTRLARTLTQRHGIDVRFARHVPAVQRDVLVLPDTLLAGEIDDDAITGFVDLHAARLRFGAIDDVAALASPGVRAVAQAIDDHRASGCFVAIYPGANAFLHRMRAVSAADTLCRWPRMAWRDKLLWRIERALWDEPPSSMERVPSLDATLAAADDLVDEARASTSTADSIRAARRIVERVRMLASAGANNMMFTADPDGTIDGTAIAAEFESDEHGASEDDARAPVSAESAASAIADTAPSTETPMPGDASPGTIRLSADNRPLHSVPLTTAFDTVTDFTGQGDAAGWHRLRGAARAQTEPLKRRLERALKVDEQTRWKREQERGALDRTSLVRLATTPGYRTPFRTPRAAPGRDAAVSLLIDCSGSMAGRKIELARLCAAALCDALMQLGFACEVLGYSSVEDAAMRAHYQRWIDDGRRTFGYNRFVERLDLRVYKRFDSDNPSGLACIECGHENPDGEALSWAAGRLLSKRARRRILMVLSDGYPATGDGNPAILRTDLSARVDALRAQRVELIGVGILDDSVESFYPVSSVVEHLNELPGAAFSVLSDTLLDRR